MSEDAHLEMDYEDRFYLSEDEPLELDGDFDDEEAPYCDYCEEVGHTYRNCPNRDDEAS